MTGAQLSWFAVALGAGVVWAIQRASGRDGFPAATVAVLALLLSLV